MKKEFLSSDAEAKRYAGRFAVDLWVQGNLPSQLSLICSLTMFGGIIR